MNFRFTQRVPESFAEQMRFYGAQKSNIEELNFPKNFSSTISESLAPHLCKICAKRFFEGDLLSIGNCLHRFCRNCMIEYATYKINVHEVVLCP